MAAVRAKILTHRGRVKMEFFKRITVNGNLLMTGGERLFVAV